jgi:hypothetical protein
MVRSPETTGSLPEYARSIESVLREATSYLAEVFDSDEAVDGASVVEWFGEWRKHAKRALENRD